MLGKLVKKKKLLRPEIPGWDPIAAREEKHWAEAKHVVVGTAQKMRRERGGPESPEKGKKNDLRVGMTLRGGIEQKRVYYLSVGCLRGKEDYRGIRKTSWKRD